MNGFLNILKPPGMTSHDVVHFIRKISGIKKVGHTGTLDPEAAGVLPICIGKATKAAQYITNRSKIYRANIKFGVETDTQDKYGKIVNKKNTPNISTESFEKILKNFTGKIQQTPPIYSAIKYKGKRLYQYAYEGKELDINSKEIEIYDISIIDKLNKNEFIFDVLCSKGTYIRTLCNDIGKEMGHGAYMSQLIRLASLPFMITNTHTLEEIEIAAKNSSLSNYILKTDYIFQDYQKVSIKDKVKRLAINGNPIYTPGINENIQDLSIKTILTLYVNNQFIGIGEICYDEKHNNNYIKIKTVFI